MNTLKITSQRIFYAVAIFIMAIALVLPAIASAAQVTSRSIAMSSSSAGAEGVAYTVNFTPAASAAAFTIDFCSNTPLIGETCTAPTGFDASGAAVTGPTFTLNGTPTANHIAINGALTASPVSVEITGIDNPSTAGTFFARIMTFDTTGNAGTATATTYTGNVDQGGVALSATETIGVSGVVLEALTFCVSGTAITQDCGTTTEPVLQLGEDQGNGVIALSPSAVSSGSIFTQITTNAVHGAVVYLKSSAAGCGGLILTGDTECIEPAGSSDITAGTAARFGVRTAAASATVGAPNPLGTLQPVAASGYNNSTYALNYNSTDESTGVTSTFGDAFIDTNSAPANNQNMELTFGATITNNTPAGSYSTDLSLIAVGTF